MMKKAASRRTEPGLMERIDQAVCSDCPASVRCRRTGCLYESWRNAMRNELFWMSVSGAKEMKARGSD